jgi:hypothetical protein
LRSNKSDLGGEIKDPFFSGVIHIPSESFGIGISQHIFKGILWEGEKEK